MTPNSPQQTPAGLLNVAGLVVAAAGIVIQYVSGVDYPTVPPGPIILLAAAAVVAFGPWRWSPFVGLVAAIFLVIGGLTATIAGNGFSETLGDPGEVGGFAGAAIQIAGLAIALPAGIVAAKRTPRRPGVPGRPRSAS
jgi:hypothetical protein